MPKDNDKENMKNIREEVHNATHMDGMLEQLAGALVNGTSIQSTPSTKKTAASLGAGVPEPEPEHMDLSALAESMPAAQAPQGDQQYRVGKSGNLTISNPFAKQASQAPQNTTPDFGDLNGVIYSILSFPFSEDRDKEIARMQQAIDKQANSVRATRIMSNTQKIVKNASSFYAVDGGGVRMEFTILGQKYSMRAKGPFMGTEALYPTVEGDKVVGLVTREQDGQLVNVTSSFDISISEGWKTASK